VKDFSKRRAIFLDGYIRRRHYINCDGYLRTYKCGRREDVIVAAVLKFEWEMPGA
jgi:hypothetical protein